MSDSVETSPVWELRALKASDLFPLAGIIGKLGLKELGGHFAQFTEDEEPDTMGIVVAIASVIAENAEAVEDDVYKFLASLAGVKPKTVGDLPPAEFVSLIEAVVTLDGFSDFFNQVSKFVK